MGISERSHRNGVNLHFFTDRKHPENPSFVAAEKKLLLLVLILTKDEIFIERKMNCAYLNWKADPFHHTWSKVPFELLLVDQSEFSFELQGSKDDLVFHQLVDKDSFWDLSPDSPLVGFVPALQLHSVPTEI